MTPRTQHLQSLVDELEARVSALPDPIEPPQAAQAFDLLLRCQAYEPEEREAAGVSARLQLLQRRLATLDLAEAAGRGVDLGRLWQRGMALLDDDAADPEAVEAWARDLLMLATLAPALPVERGERAREVVQRCLDLAGSDPRGFLGAATVVLDRFELEAPDGLDPFAVRAHRALEVLPLEAAIDASAPALSEDKLRSLLDPIRNGSVWRESQEGLPAEGEPWIHAIRPREQQQVGPGTLPPWWEKVLDRADDALQDAFDWKQNLAAMLARIREPGLVPIHADGDLGDMARMGRHLGFDWWLLHDARGLWLHGPENEHVTVTARIDGQEHELEAVAVEGAQRWRLPTVDSWPQGLSLLVRLGFDSFELALPGEGNEA